MNSVLKRWMGFTGTFATVAFGLAFAHQASASCAQIDITKSTALDSLGSDTKLGNVRFMRTAFLQIGDRDTDDNEPIVGLWRFKFIAKGNKGPPDGTVIDDGVVTWHADKTEITNSGKPPITSSFCMGVWKKVGERTYHLNHIGLSWDGTGTVYIGPASIKETVTVDRNGRTYSGTFSITQYSLDEKTVLQAVKGIVTGDRVNAD